MRKGFARADASHGWQRLEKNLAVVTAAQAPIEHGDNASVVNSAQQASGPLFEGEGCFGECDVAEGVFTEAAGVLTAGFHQGITRHSKGETINDDQAQRGPADVDTFPKRGRRKQRAVAMVAQLIEQDGLGALPLFEHRNAHLFQGGGQALVGIVHGAVAGEQQQRSSLGEGEQEEHLVVKAAHVLGIIGLDHVGGAVQSRTATMIEGRGKDGADDDVGDDVGDVNGFFVIAVLLHCVDGNSVCRVQGGASCQAHREEKGGDVVANGEGGAGQNNRCVVGEQGARQGRADIDGGRSDVGAPRTVIDEEYKAFVGGGGSGQVRELGAGAFAAAVQGLEATPLHGDFSVVAGQVCTGSSNCHRQRRQGCAGGFRQLGVLGGRSVERALYSRPWPATDGGKERRGSGFDLDTAVHDGGAVIAEASVAQVPVELQGSAPTDPGLRLRRLAWAAGILVALLLVLVQQLWLGRAQGMQDPRWRPRYQSLCEVIGCELAPYRDLRRIRSDGLLVRPDPARPGLLLLDAVIVNKAVFPQAFPGLELAFSDIQGSPVMTRVFRPEEYLGGAALREGAMRPGEPVSVHLEIPDPGEQATNYELRLTELSGN